MSTHGDKFSLQAGKRLAEERARLFESQAAAGGACGVSRVMWGQYERGQAAPGGSVWFKLANLGADVQYILTGERTKRPSARVAHELAGYEVELVNPEEAELLKNYRSSSPEVRAAAMRVLAGEPPKRIPRPATAVEFGGELPPDHRKVKERIKIRSGDFSNTKPTPARKRKGEAE